MMKTFRSNNRPAVRAIALALAGLAVSCTQGAVTFVADRAALGANDQVNWASAGSSPSYVANPLVVTSATGKSVTASKPDGFEFVRYDEGADWIGNFAPGDALLWMAGFGPLRLDFSEPVAGAGAQIAATSFGDFQATIEAFNSAGNSLGQFTVTGISSDEGDNSAVFIGIASDAGDIARVEMNVLGYQQDFAVNRLDLRLATVTPPDPDPEPVVEPQGAGYWKNHQDLWPVTTLTLGKQSYGQAELVRLLGQPKSLRDRTDASLILARQLVAAKLNVAAGVDATKVDELIGAADELLAGYRGKLPYGVRPITHKAHLMLRVALLLDRFNEDWKRHGCGHD